MASVHSRWFLVIPVLSVVSVFRDDTLQRALDKMAAVNVDEPPVADRRETEEWQPARIGDIIRKEKDGRRTPG